MTKSTPKKMSMIESARLVMLIETRYAEKKLTDAEFAKWASQELGFEVVPGHVNNRRTELGIAATQQFPGHISMETATIKQRIEDIDKRLSDLERALGVVKK